MTAPKRRWPRFSLRTLFVVVTLIGTSMWALIETRRTEQFKAAAERLQQENAQVKSQQEALEAFLEITRKRQQPPLTIKGAVPDHWLEPED